MSLQLVETNQQFKRMWLIAASVLALVAISVIAWRTRLSADENLEREAIKAVKKSAWLQSGKFWRSPGLVKDWVTGKANEGQYMATYARAGTNLLHTGYLVKQRIRFEHGTHSWNSFSDALDKRLGEREGLWSCRFLKADSTIEVVARSNAIPIWEALVREFDQPPAKSD